MVLILRHMSRIIVCGIVNIISVKRLHGQKFHRQFSHVVMSLMRFYLGMVAQCLFSSINICFTRLDC